MNEEMETSQPTQQERPRHPRPARNCSDLVDVANERVKGRNKYFTVKSWSSSEGVCAGEGCAPIEVDMRPCFELRWGDGPNDQLETDDYEVLYFVASNPYTNILFKDVMIIVSKLYLDEDQPVPHLPDRTPSVDVTPTEFICFGDLPPATEGSNQRQYVSREVVLISRGARPGDYSLAIEYCFSIELFYPLEDKFQLELVAS